MTADQHDDLWSFAQPPADEARRLRDQGAEVALVAADTRGRLAGEEAIRRLARSGREFTAEDVRELVGAPLACGQNVLGALLLAAARRDEITATGYTKAGRASSRSRVLRTWKGTGRTPDTHGGTPGSPGPPPDPCGASDISLCRIVSRDTPDGGTGPGPLPPPSPPDRPERGLGRLAGKNSQPVAGKWTAADETAPCVACGRPAFLRLHGVPRHRADCGA